MNVFTNYLAVTAAGAVIKTFGDRDQATNFANANASTYPGIRVLEFTRTETTRVLWSGRHQLVRAGR
jgi:hypothetical protein